MQSTVVLGKGVAARVRFWEGLVTMLLSPQTKSLLDNLPTSQGMYKHMVEKGKARRIMDSQHMSRRVAFFLSPLAYGF